MLKISIRVLTISILLFSIIFSTYVFAGDSDPAHRDTMDRISSLENKRKVISQNLDQFKAAKKEYDAIKPKYKKTKTAWNHFVNKHTEVDDAIQKLKDSNEEARGQMGSVRRFLYDNLRASFSTTTMANNAKKMYYYPKLKYFESQMNHYGDKMYDFQRRMKQLKDKIKGMQDAVKAISGDPKQFMRNSKAELDRLYKEVEKSLTDDERDYLDSLRGGDKDALKDVGTEDKGMDGKDPTVGGNMLGWTPPPEDSFTPVPPDDKKKDDKPNWVEFSDLNKDKTGKSQPSKPAGGATGTKTAQSPSPPKFVGKADMRGSGPASQVDVKQGTGQRDDYRIVSIAAETVPVTYGKQTLQKLKNINAAVIVIEIRGKQHIIDNEEAVSVLIEKGYFYRFPGIGLVATIKYSDFGGYSDGYDEIGKGKDPFGKPVQEGCAGKEPDISCKNYSEKCGGVSSSSSKKVLRDSEGRTRRGSVTNWKAVWCADQKKACQAWYANGCKHKRDENFDDKFIEFKANPKDAELYGGAAGPQSR